MSFVRPEAISYFQNYRGFILSAMIVIAGVYILASSFGTTRIAGGIILIIGLLVGHDAYRRFKFPNGRGGRGVLEVDELSLIHI